MELGRREFSILLLLLVFSLAAWGFAEIAGEVMEGDTRAFDETVLLAMRSPASKADPWGPHWLQEVARDVTGLGGVAILSSISIFAAGYLYLRGKRRAMWFLILAIGGGILVSTILKQGFDRPRPELVPHGSYVYTTSFPSGHSMMSAIAYLTLGALLARVEPRRALKAYLLAISIFLTLAVGISRAYLGVHWPTDVLAGWASGAAWAVGCWTLANILQRKGAIEGAPATRPDVQLPNASRPEP